MWWYRVYQDDVAGEDHVLSCARHKEAHDAGALHKNRTLRPLCPWQHVDRDDEEMWRKLKEHDLLILEGYPYCWVCHIRNEQC
jgi:hypothetical protein